MPPTTSWKRFAEEVEIGLGLGVVGVEFNKENFCLGWVDFPKENGSASAQQTST